MLRKGAALHLDLARRNGASRTIPSQRTELELPPMSIDFPPRRLLSGRRLALLAGVAGLGAAFAFSGQDFSGQDFGLSHFGFSPNLNSFTAPAFAQTSQRPAGFADIVEKVKPSVMSVRVKMGAQAQTSGLNSEEDPFGPNSPFRDFFRRFGQPDGNNMPGHRG